MKKASLILTLGVVIISCSSKQNLQSRVQQYMKDTVVANFNDPASYQFVSMDVDTIKGSDYDRELMDQYTSELDKTKDQLRQLDFETDTTDQYIVREPLTKLVKLRSESIDLVKSHPTKADSIVRYDINVKCRGKNKMGALILNNVKLQYQPSIDKISEVSQD